MQYEPQKDAFTAKRDATYQSMGMPTKSKVILIRWPVVLISCSLILFRTSTIPLAPVLNMLVAL